MDAQAVSQSAPEPPTPTGGVKNGFGSRQFYRDLTGTRQRARFRFGRRGVRGSSHNALPVLLLMDRTRDASK